MGQRADIDELLASTQYRVVRFLGRGGMGEVFLIEHQFLGRQFALKVLNAKLLAAPEFAERLRLEAQSAARLHHPNIVEMIDFWFTAGGVPCAVMELLEGKTLAEELAIRRSLPLLEAIDFACQALAGLAAAHAIGLVHRDVKPENLFLHEVPQHGRVLKLLDFGLAVVLPGVSDRAPQPLAVATNTGALIGSPRFMSPEQARRERVDHRADICSLGLVFYEMLVGHGPYDDGSWDAKPPSYYVPGEIPAELDAIVMRAIREDAGERYQSAGEFLADLKSVAKVSQQQLANR